MRRLAALLLLVAPLSGRTATWGPTTVSASADDAYQDLGGVVTLTGTTIGASLDNTGEWIITRFPNVTIPNAATISAATWEVVPSGTAEDEPLVTIYLEAADNCAQPTTGSNNISSRSRTTGTAWSATNMGADGATYFAAPDLTTDVQAVIDRAGWASGNALCVIVQGGATSTRDLTVEAYDLGPGTNPPRLTITYTTATNVDQTVTATGGNGAAGAVSTSLGVEQTATATGGNGAAGTVSTETGVAVTVTGSSGVGEVGAVVTETGSPVTVTVTATGGNGAAGAVSTAADALATVVASSGLGAAGAVSASTGVGPTVTGAAGQGAAGTVSAGIGSTVAVTSASGVGAAGTVAAVISGDVTTSVTGASGSGAAGILSAIGTALATLTSAVGTGLAGVVGAAIIPDTPVTVTLTGVAGAGLAGILSVAQIDLTRAPRATGIMGRPVGELPTRPPSTTLQVR